MRTAIASETDMSRELSAAQCAPSSHEFWNPFQVLADTYIYTASLRSTHGGVL